MGGPAQIRARQAGRRSAAGPRCRLPRRHVAVAACPCQLPAGAAIRCFRVHVLGRLWVSSCRQHVGQGVGQARPAGHVSTASVTSADVRTGRRRRGCGSRRWPAPRTVVPRGAGRDQVDLELRLPGTAPTFPGNVPLAAPHRHRWCCPHGMSMARQAVQQAGAFHVGCCCAGSRSSSRGWARRAGASVGGRVAARSAASGGLGHVRPARRPVVRRRLGDGSPAGAVRPLPPHSTDLVASVTSARPARGRSRERGQGVSARRTALDHVGRWTPAGPRSVRRTRGHVGEPTRGDLVGAVETDGGTSRGDVMAGAVTHWAVGEAAVRPRHPGAADLAGAAGPVNRR